MALTNTQKALLYGTSGAILLFIFKDSLFKGAKYVQSKFGDFVSQFSRKWVGVKEIGVNRAFANDLFQSMMKNVGWGSGDQWCMYFAKAIHYEAFKNNPTEQAKIKKILTGNTQDSYKRVQNDKTNTYVVVESGKPRIGDIAIWRRSASRGHAGVVVEVGDTTMTTIEGNTGDKSIHDGDLVAKKTRPLAYGKPIGRGSDLKLRGFIRKTNV
jgi:hypothetical protein